MKNRSINILIVAIFLLTLMSITLVFFLQKAEEDFPKDIRVKQDGVTQTILPIRDLRLNPTESKEYTVDLFCAASGSYNVSLDYTEMADGGMKPFVNVIVRVNGALMYEGGLDSLLTTDEVISFETELSADDPVVLSLTYLMPREIGNEAQGTYSDFNILLSIKKT
ncbi:MAG: hypothetical protein IKV16_06370 [Clostridia bacterium]|nr:hypothetical protein [Clostridia bacterium]